QARGDARRRFHQVSGWVSRAARVRRRVGLARGSRPRWAFGDVTARLRALGLLARFTLIGASVAVVLATGVALFFQDRLTDRLLAALTTRATGQVDLGFRTLITPADFHQPVTAEQVADLGGRLDPPAARIHAAGGGIIRI